MQPSTNPIRETTTSLLEEEGGKDAERLATVRAQTKGIEKSEEIVVEPVPRGRYIAAITIAVCADILDVVLSFVVVGTGFSAAILIFVLELIIIDLPLYMLLGRKRFEKARDDLKSGVKKLESVERRLERMNVAYGRALSAASKVRIPAIRNTVKAVASKVERLRSAVTQRVSRTFLLRVGLDKIPLIELWPWRSLAVIKLFKEHREMYKTSLEVQKAQAEAAEDLELLLSEV